MEASKQEIRKTLDEKVNTVRLHRLLASFFSCVSISPSSMEVSTKVAVPAANPTSPLLNALSRALSGPSIKSLEISVSVVREGLTYQEKIYVDAIQHKMLISFQLYIKAV